jgi:hypothetical protein
VQADWRRHPARTRTSFTALGVRLPPLPLEESIRMVRNAIGSRAAERLEGSTSSLSASPWPHRLWVRTRGFHPRRQGSSPCEAAKPHWSSGHDAWFSARRSRVRSPHAVRGNTYRCSRRERRSAVTREVQVRALVSVRMVHWPSGSGPRLQPAVPRFDSGMHLHRAVVVHRREQDVANVPSAVRFRVTAPLPLPAARPRPL